MMNFESVTHYLLRDATTLTSMLVSLACFFIHSSPILTVVREPSAAPAWAFLASDISRLPFTHTLTTTEIMFFYVCILSMKLLTAPITVQYLATPAQKNAPAFRTASNLFGFLRLVQAVRLHCKEPAAYRTFKGWGGRVSSAILILTRATTEPKTRWVVGDSARFSLQVISARGALNSHKCFHKSIISYLVACQNLNRRGRAIEISPAYCAVTLQRMADAFPGIEIKRLK